MTATLCLCGAPATGEVTMYRKARSHWPVESGWGTCLPCGVRDVARYWRLWRIRLTWRRTA